MLDKGVWTDGPQLANIKIQTDSVLMINSAVQCDRSAQEQQYQEQEQYRRLLTITEDKIVEERERLRLEFENELKAALANICDRIERTSVDKNDIERHFGDILGELKRYQNENMALTTRYDQHLTGLKEQISLIKVPCETM